MSNILVTVAILSAIWVTFILIRAAVLPNNFRVSRSTSIHASREKVFEFINDMKAFNQWNPFAKMDPSTKTEYRGAVTGPGAAFDWEGTGKAGKGSSEIVEVVAPTQQSLFARLHNFTRTHQSHRNWCKTRIRLF